MAKKLARIVHDAPVTLRINEAKLKPFDTPESLEALQELGFASLVKRVMTDLKYPLKASGPVQYLGQFPLPKVSF